MLGGRYAYINTKYPLILKNIASKRGDFLKSYKLAKTADNKKKVINQARNYLNEVLPQEVFPAWYGTPWSFNGNAARPLQGTIACGSFVENVLKNVGFAIDSRMSAQPSEYIIKNICEKQKISRFLQVPIGPFNTAVQSMGEGVYLVGLDRHVGFLTIHQGKYRFIHSHGYLCVVSEVPSLSPLLRMSKYRVVGKLFDDRMIEQWLYGKKVLLKHDYFQQKH